MPVLALVALAAQMNLPACTIQTRGMGEPVLGQWVREATPYILAAPADSGSLIHTQIRGREYFVVWGGTKGAVLDFGTRDEEGPHLKQTIAIGPGELASFVCVASGEA